MKTVRLTIDGMKIFAEEGTTILEAARQNGIEIPTLCYHPRLAPLGHCRICLVNVEGIEKPITSCDNPVGEGMTVVTSTPEIEAMRSQILSLSLATHPYKDCLTCERTGTCELQENAYNFKVDLPEQLDRDLTAENEEDNDYIVRDEEKCILCGRCVQICRTGAGCFVYEMIGNGVNTRVAPIRDGKVVSLEEAGCIFCGQCVDACPVAALSEKKRAFAGREWELSHAPGLCVACSLGCILERQAAGDRLIRVSLPAESDKGARLCKKGKFGSGGTAEHVLNKPLVREGNDLKETGYEQAVREAAGALNQLKNTAGSDSLAVVATGYCSNEESYLLQKLARSVIATPNIDLGVDGNWARAYKGMIALTGAGVSGPTISDLQGAKTLVIVGSGLEESHPVAAMAIAEAARFGKAAVVRIGAEAGENTAWQEIGIKPKDGFEGAVLKSLAEIIRGHDAATAAAEAGLSADDLKRTAELITQPGSYMVVSPEYFSGDASGKVDLLLEMAGTAGLIAPGRCNLLLLSNFSNAAGIFASGGSAAYGPGHAELNGAAGLNRDEIAEAVKAGRIKGLLAFGPGLEGIDTGKLEYFAISCPFEEEVCKSANLVLPALTDAGKEGTFTNAAGQTVYNEAVVKPAADQKEDWRIICDLAAAMGAEWDYTSLDDVQKEMANMVTG